MISIALYKPDIPQNTAAIIRLCACFDMMLHIIEPCGFSLDDSRFKRVVMDYININNLKRYENFNKFREENIKRRIILMTTKSKSSYTKFIFKRDDILLFGRESKGVPVSVHSEIMDKLKIPINKKTRSLNVAMSVAIVSCEALRQNKFLK